MEEGSSSQPPIICNYLLCREDKSWLDEDKLGTQFLNSQIVPYYQDWVFEDDYVKMLVQRERFSSSNSTASSSNYPSWVNINRSLTINWILNANTCFGFHNRTAYLSVLYMDRFLSRKYIHEHQQWVITLLGIACLSLAAKMDERNVPALSEYTVPHFVFDCSMIQNMELLVLTTLEWRMSLITPFVYLNYIAVSLCDQDATQTDELISKATDLIMALIKGSNSTDDHSPFVVAAAAIVAASDWQLTQEALKLKISTVSLWEISDNLQQKQQQEEQLIYCYGIMQKICAKDNPSTPNLTEVDQTDTPSTTTGTKRKLTFRDSDQINPDSPDDK